MVMVADIVPWCILDHKQRLESFCIHTPRELKASLATASDTYIDCLCEIVYNFVYGFLPVSKDILSKASKNQVARSDFYNLASVECDREEWKKLDKRAIIFKRRKLIKAIIRQVLAAAKLYNVD